MIELFFVMLSMHALCDYPLQGDFIGRFKNRHINRDPAFNAKSPIPWWHLMIAHSLIHAGGVYMVTQYFGFFIAELIAHFIIDCLKCEGYTDINVDQALHVVCKVVYVGVVFYA